MTPLIDQGLTKGLIAFDAVQKNILYKTQNKRLRYLNKVFYAPFDGLCSTEFHVLEGVTVSSEFLALFLRSQLVVKQTEHLMSGNTLPRLQTEDIEDLLIPIVDESTQNQTIEEANRRMIEAESLRREAETELEAAKRRIEAMLLGEVA